MSAHDMEKIIGEVLTGETKQNALDFAVFLKANEFHTGGEHGAVTYKDEAVCYMHLDGSEQALRWPTLSKHFFALVKEIWNPPFRFIMLKGSR